MTSILKATTAMVLCLSVTTPTGAFAQSTQPETTTATEGAVDATVSAEEQARLAAEAAAEEAETAASAAEAEAAKAAQEAEVRLQEEAEAAAAEADTKAQAGSEAKAAADAADADAATKAEAEAEAQAKADKEAAAAEQAAAEADAKAAAEDGAAAQAQQAAEAEADAKAAEAAAQASTGAEVKAEEAAVPETAETEPTGPTGQDTAGKNEPAGTQASERVLTPEQEARREARRAARQAERQAARKATAAAQKDAETAEVTSEQVTEENTRSSDEDFDTSVTGTQATTARSGGLSKFEQALLLGLGAVVVGNVLNNGDEVVSNSGDRVVVRRDGDLRVLKNDNALLRQPGSDIRTETFADGSTRTTVTRPNGDQVVTIAASDGTVIERFVRRSDGTEVVLIDDTRDVDAVDVTRLAARQDATETSQSAADADALRAALTAKEMRDNGRRFSLGQVRDIRAVRELVPTIELDALTFDTGSAAIRPSQAEELASVGRAIADTIAGDPGAVFLIEGHTDAVGNRGYNLALSDRRAETVALALTEYFDVPPENLVTQGYGEDALKIRTESAERANRRAAVRNVTPLLR